VLFTPSLYSIISRHFVSFWFHFHLIWIYTLFTLLWFRFGFVFSFSSFILTPCLYFFISVSVVLLFVYILDCFGKHCWFQFIVFKKIHGNFTVVFLLSWFSLRKSWVVLNLRKKWNPKEKERKSKWLWCINSPKQPKNEMKWKQKD